MKWPLALWLCLAPLTSPGQTYEERAVAAILMAEAWSEGVRGMTAVAEVIHQRAEEKDQTPLQVVAARRGRIHAFSCLNGTTLSGLIRKFEDAPDFQDALHIAHMACQTPGRLPDITNSANHYTRRSEHPYWAKGKKPVAVIGHHAFYKLNRY